ncbi:MAG: M48 family metalloprotease [Desulfobacterales bacterium]|nr:M48 family metalloprotease [Desulfobacterales bacterium]
MNFLKRVTAVCLSLVFLITSNAAAISIPDEEKLGKEFMQMVRDQGVVLHDPVARHMINVVGNHIVAVLPPQPFHFDFNLINDDSFNAFASPAANIFIHRGLIATLETMDEFAGVMAHEVAHAASRHVSQSIDRSKMVAVGSLAGMLAGVLLGSAVGGEAASALSIGSVAAGQSTMLAFTRENETEADQKAVLFLDKTGYNPEGLLSGLNKIRETDYQGIEGIPDYFKTHPGTGNRIAHLAGILADYTPPADKPAPPENFDYQMVKYRVIGLYGDPEVYAAKVEQKLGQDPDNPALNYGMGLLYGRTHRTGQGIAHLQKALAKEIFNPMILLELGRLHINNGAHDTALSVLEGITQDKVVGDLATYYTAVAQLESGNLSAARTNLNKVLERNKKGEYARANYHLANILSQEQNAPMSHYYLGIYYTEIRDYKNAFRHLNRAVDTLEDPKVKEEARERLEKLRDKARQRKR